MAKKLIVKKDDELVTLLDEKEIQNKLDEKVDNNTLDALSDQIDDIVAGDLDLTNYVKKNELTAENITDKGDYYGIFPSTYASPNTPTRTQEEINVGIDSAIASIREAVVEVSTLPTASQDTYGKIYIIKNPTGFPPTPKGYQMHITVRSGFSPNYNYDWASILYLDENIKKSSTTGLMKNEGSIDTAEKVNKSQGSTNANKNVVTDANGNITIENKPTKLASNGSIPSTATSLEDYTAEGYYSGSSTVAGNITDMPYTGNYSFLIENKHYGGGSFVQFCYKMPGSNITEIYYRKKVTGNNITDWRQIANKEDAPEYITSTHTSSTSTWTGTCTKIAELKKGTCIFYRLNQNLTTGNVTLDLTLRDGTTTGARNVYIGGRRLTNQFDKYNVIHMVFDGNNWFVINGQPSTTTVTITYEDETTETINFVTR